MPAVSLVATLSPVFAQYYFGTHAPAIEPGLRGARRGRAARPARVVTPGYGGGGRTAATDVRAPFAVL